MTQPKRTISRAETGAKPNAPRRAEFTPHHGALTLMLAGHPAAPVFMDLPPDATSAQITASAAECHLYRLCKVDLCWTGSQQYDYAQLDARLQTLREADPASHYLLEISVNAPEWWRQTHLTECASFCLPPPADALETLPPASWASRRWRTEGGNALISLLRHVQQGNSGTRLLGVQIGAGAGDWRHEQAERQPDTGPRMTEHYRNFALDKYRRNEGLLRKAWFDARATFAGMVCPTSRDRSRADNGAFRNPARSRRLLDYYEAFYDAQNIAALHFCETAKRTLGEDSLIGLNYASLFGAEARAEAGHAYPEPVLNSEWVDFCVTAAAFGGTMLNAPVGSLALRGKFLLIAPGEDKTLVPALSALAFTHNAGLCLPVTTPPAELKTVQSIAETAVHAPTNARKRVSQFAVLVDPTASLYIHSGAGWLNEILLSGQFAEFAALGAPIEIYLLADIYHPKLSDAKAWLLANAFYLSEAERRRVDARIKRSNHLAIFAAGVGLIGEERVAGEEGQQVVGQKLRMEANASNLRVRVSETNDALTWGQRINTTFGTERALSPTITITDRAIVRLGANTDNKTNFAVLRHPTWTSVYCGGPPLPLALLQNALKAAGCHLYAESATVFADARSVAVVSHSNAPFTISLPGLHDVRDALTTETLASHVTEFSVTLKPGTTGCYELRPYPAKKTPRPEPEEAEKPARKAKKRR